MFCYDDAWLANESLAFYMSTNTFSNPIFVDAQPEPEANVKEPNKEPQRAKQLKQRKSKRDVSEDGWDSFADDRHGGRWWALYDGLAFSVKSKIYVLELNFKRELRRLKRFASDHLPCFMLPNKQRNPLSGAEKWSCWLSSSSCSQNRASFIKDEFWKEVEELSSRKALEKQQEKVLNRLEKVLEAIRSEQQREQSYEQQQQSDGNDQLFNMSEASLSDGVAMQFVGHPIVSHKSIMMSSGLTSLLGSKSPSFCSQLGRQQHKFENGHRAIRAGKRKARWISVSKGGAPAAKRRVKDATNDYEENNAKKLCIVCYTNSPNIVTLPCKHHDICSDCFIEIIYMAVKRSQYPLKCVLCRQKIEKIRCSRRLLLSVIGKNRIRP